MRNRIGTCDFKFKSWRFFYILFFIRDVKELNSTQAKISVETAKEVANDKTFKTKNAKDKRLREKKQNNIKRFMEEKKVS